MKSRFTLHHKKVNEGFFAVVWWLTERSPHLFLPERASDTQKLMLCPRFAKLLF